MRLETIQHGDRRWHDSIRACADLLAVQVRQGVMTRREAEQNAINMGVSVEILTRAIEANK